MTQHTDELVRRAVAAGIILPPTTLVLPCTSQDAQDRQKKVLGVSREAKCYP